MTLAAQLRTMAEWIQGRALLEQPPARFERVKQHIVDTVGARLAGSRIAEGRTAGRVAMSIEDAVSSAIVAGCAQARCTEIDDIHLASCTTPGAVVVPTALALAAARRIQSTGECCAAVLVGYETVVRLGVAIDGPSVLHRHIWPTHAAAALGSAATASRAFGLSIEQTAGALATALAFGSGPPVPAASPESSRWLTLGIAAANGELAARAAGEGLLGAVGDADASLHAGLVTGLGRRYLFDGIGIKPFPTARQGLAAIEGARGIARAQGLTPDDINRIVVFLPELQRRIVDRLEMPSSRFTSMVNVRYQIALAIAAPDRLADVDRTPLYEDEDVRALMSKIRVRRARDLDSRYPKVWPARVEITAHGRRFIRLVLHPSGDGRRPFDWGQVAQKFVRLASPAIGDAAAQRMVGEMRDAGPRSAMPPLWNLH